MDWIYQILYATAFKTVSMQNRTLIHNNFVSPFYGSEALFHFIKVQ